MWMSPVTLRSACRLMNFCAWPCDGKPLEPHAFQEFSTPSTPPTDYYVFFNPSSPAEEGERNLNHEILL